MHMVFPYIVGRKALKPFNVCDQTSNFMSKIRTFAHRFCNSKTCLHYLMPGMTCVFLLLASMFLPPCQVVVAATCLHQLLYQEILLG